MTTEGLRVGKHSFAAAAVGGSTPAQDIVPDAAALSRQLHGMRPMHSTRLYMIAGITTVLAKAITGTRQIVHGRAQALFIPPGRGA